MQSFKLKFLGVTILQGVKFPIFLLIFEWALQQCSATALPVIFISPLQQQHQLFSLGVTAETLLAKRDRKSAISLQRDQFDPKFPV